MIAEDLYITRKKTAFLFLSSDIIGPLAGKGHFQERAFVVDNDRL
jgi:hypothetical protein